MIRRLKSTPNASSVLSSFKGSAHTAVRPSEMRTVRAVLPPTEYGIEFELNILHHIVYPVLEPLDLGSIDFSALRRNSRRISRIALPAESSISTQVPLGDSFITTPTTVPAPSAHVNDFSEAPPVAGAIPNRLYCDSRLNRLNIRYWTQVPVSNDFSARVLSNYLESDHLICACLDADLFLADLVDLKHDHCSPLLLSALMAFACVSIV
jgi:hypothetical protein